MDAFFFTLDLGLTSLTHKYVQTLLKCFTCHGCNRKTLYFFFLKCSALCVLPPWISGAFRWRLVLRNEFRRAVVRSLGLGHFLWQQWRQFSFVFGLTLQVHYCRADLSSWDSVVNTMNLCTNVTSVAITITVLNGKIRFIFIWRIFQSRHRLICTN